MPVTERVMDRFESSGRARYERAYNAFHSVQFGERESVINLTSHGTETIASSIRGKLGHPLRGAAKTAIRPAP